jgi:hypothetical protein
LADIEAAIRLGISVGENLLINLGVLLQLETAWEKLSDLESTVVVREPNSDSIRYKDNRRKKYRWRTVEIVTEAIFFAD